MIAVAQQNVMFLTHSGSCERLTLNTTHQVSQQATSCKLLAFASISEADQAASHHQNTMLTTIKPQG